MNLPFYSGLTFTYWGRSVEVKENSGQETQYTEPQFNKYKIMPTKVKGGDLHPWLYLL